MGEGVTDVPEDGVPVGLAGAIRVPALHIVFLPFLIHVYFFPFEVTDWPIFEQEVPGFGATA